MDHLIVILALTLGLAYGNTIPRRTVDTMPLWWTQSAGARTVLQILDFVVVVAFLALVVWAFMNITWWMVLVWFFVAGLVIGPQIVMRFYPFSIQLICGPILIIIALLAYLS